MYTYIYIYICIYIYIYIRTPHAADSQSAPTLATPTANQTIGSEWHDINSREGWHLNEQGDLSHT